MSDTIKRFSNRVENYVKYRPDYPREIVEFLRYNCGLNHDSIVADVGCGTGISARMFLENGIRVIGVEPNEEMRAAAEKYLEEHPFFRIVDGTAENTMLPNASVDMVVAAQAFHWFDRERTGTEFRRILKPGGSIVLIWNERQIDTTSFLREYEAFLVEYARDYEVVRHDRVDETILTELFGAGVRTASFQHVQDFDFDGLKGRMLSSSYMPTESDAIYDEMIKQLQVLFAKHAENGRIKVFYDTNVFYSQV